MYGFAVVEMDNGILKFIKIKMRTSAVLLWGMVLWVMVVTRVVAVRNVSCVNLSITKAAQ